MIYPIGIQNFEKIRENGFAYIDKTKMIYDLAHRGTYYFLSRPRRFGKSLLVSTMEAYFCGKKELFEGLAIAGLENEWIQYPVLHVDFSGNKYGSEKDLDTALEQTLRGWEEKYGVKDVYDTFPARFKEVIDTASAKTGRQVVILIDEYDKPIVDNLDKEELAEKFRITLQGFYSVMKSKDACIRFGFLTGVTKIGKMSVFSGLNNLEDISLDPAYAGICGISEAEIRQTFEGSVEDLAEANGYTRDECYARLEEMYDGYHFSRDTSVGEYNPFSLLRTFKSKMFEHYWFETGTPNFLVTLMRRTSYDVTKLSSEEVDSSLLTDVDGAFDNPIPLLYQAGYLTIKGYDKKYRLYKLGFPNMEVKDGFLNFLLKFYAPVGTESTVSLISQMTRDIESGRAEDFMKRLEALFAKTTYQIQGESEKDFQYAMYIILELMGEYVEVEKETSDGRIDALIQTDKFIYIIEIKVNETAEAALRQIGDKGYARQFSSDKRKVFRIGVRFSTEKRCIDEWEVE